VYYVPAAISVGDSILARKEIILLIPWNIRWRVYVSPRCHTQKNMGTSNTTEPTECVNISLKVAIIMVEHQTQRDQNIVYTFI